MTTMTSTNEAHLDSKAYFRLVEEGLLAPDDRVELLEGIIVAMGPQQPAHAATVWRVGGVLDRLVARRAMVRSQLPFLAGVKSVPEPDLAVVPWDDDEWQFQHPDRCLLAVEVADSSLPQDRLTKSRIYAAASVTDYWIVNLRNRTVEWFSSPDPAAQVYAKSGVASGSEALSVTALGLSVVADELFPPRRPSSLDA